MPPPPSNHRKQPALPLSALPPQRPHHGQHTRRPVREKRQDSHPPVTNFFLEVQETPAPRLSAASIIPIPPSVRQSTVSDLDDVFRASPVAPDLPALPALYNPTGAPPKPTEAERYKQRYLNRRTLPAGAALAAPSTHRGRARTQSLGSVSSTSTGEPQRQRSTTDHSHYHKRTPSNQTLAAIVERPLPALPRRIFITTQDSRDPPSNTHVHFTTTTQPSKSVPYTGPSDPPRSSDDSRPSTTSPNTVSGSPTSTLVHPSPLQERQPSPIKTPSKKRIMSPFTHLFKRDRSASVSCPPTSTATTATTNDGEHQKRSITPTPSKFSSLPAISTPRISRPIVRSISTSIPVPRHRPWHHGEMSAAVKRVRRVTPLTEVDMYSKKNWRSSIMEERKVPAYNPPSDSPYASHGRYDR